MSQHYIFATQSIDLEGMIKQIQDKISLPEFLSPGLGENPAPKPGDTIVIALGRDGGYEMIEPYLFKMTNISKKWITVQLERAYLKHVPIDTVRSILNRALGDGGNLLEPAEQEAILAQMGGVKLTEAQLLDHVRHYISARGYYFPDEAIYNYHICLKTRPFVILAGLSGTGKSKLSQLYGEALGHTVKNGRYLRLAVRPSWNDDRYLLGYLSTITGEYITEPAVEFMMQAEQDRDNLYFFCLDEMNLAHVEHYFSQFLSALEEEDPADRRIPLFSKTAQARLSSKDRKISQEREIFIPTNLLFTGTINVDETTQPLSDKVIDRANTIEFFEVELDKIPLRQPTPEVTTIAASTWQSYKTTTPDSRYRDLVVEIGKLLNQAGLGLGYRVLREIEMYIANSGGLLEPEVAFDLQVKQRILPRLRGTITIQSTLKNLMTFTNQHNLMRSHYRLAEMENRLKRDGYTSFWR